MATNIPNRKSVTDFFIIDKPAFGSYDNIRKIPNYIDGLKISQRKLIWTAFEKCDKEFIKTETFANLTALRTNYIHGSSSLCSVATSLVQNFPGSNNYQYLLGNSGGWGCRMLPVASAPRYTRVKLSPLTRLLFNVVDNETLEKQYFEGSYIEPKYLIPIFPTIFLNPSSGISTGFASDIYSRNPTEIIDYIEQRLAGVEKPALALLPWFKNHLGRIAYNPILNRNESFGVISKNNLTSYTITELPIGMEYQKYISHLDALVEAGTIQDYEDKCDPKSDVIVFLVKTTREFSKTIGKNERKLYDTFRLIRGLPETLCCIDENNRVKEFTSIFEILNAFIEMRLKYYIIRKDYILATLKDKLETMESKYLFIKGIVNDTIIVSKTKKEDVVKQLELIKEIIKIDGTYDYLLRMQISSLTAEMLEDLATQIAKNKAEYTKIKETDVKVMWETDLEEFRKFI